MIDEKLRKSVADTAQTAAENTAELAERQRLIDANTEGPAENRRLLSTVLREEVASDRVVSMERARGSDRKHLAATELMQQMPADIQHISQQPAG